MNKTKIIFLDEVNELNLSLHFDKIIGAEEAKIDKPSKVFTDKAIENFENPEIIVSIGDGASDVQMANNYKNGISILVFSNSETTEFKTTKPTYCAQDLEKCKQILASID